MAIPIPVKQVDGSSVEKGTDSNPVSVKPVDASGNDISSIDLTTYGFEDIAQVVADLVMQNYSYRYGELQTLWAPGVDSTGETCGKPGAAVSLAADDTAYLVNVGSYAFGDITCTTKASYANNDYRTIGDGVHSALTYEFKIDGAFVATPDRVTVDISGDTTAQNVATTLQAVLDAYTAGTGQLSGLSFGTPADGVFTVTNTAIGTAGNVAMGGGATPAGNVVRGMTGGHANVILGGEGGQLAITKSSAPDAAGHPTYWADYILVKHSDPVPTAANAKAWANAGGVWVRAPSDPDLSFDLYVFRGASGKTGMYASWANGQAT